MFFKVFVLILSLINLNSAKRPFFTSYSGHTGPVNAIINWKGNQVVTGSSDRSIKIWDPIDNIFGIAKTTINASSPVNCLVSLKNFQYLASGGDDGVIRIWDIEKQVVVKTLSNHTKPVLSLIVLDNGDLASASADNTIIIWNQFDGTISQTLRGHTNSVNVLLVYNQKLVSGSDDGSVIFWDLKKGKPDKIIGNLTPVKSLAVYIEKSTVPDKPDGRVNPLNSIKTRRDEPMMKLFSGSDKIRILKEDGTTDKTFPGGTYGKILSLIVLNEKIFSGSEDGSVREWSLSGKVEETFTGSTVPSIIPLNVVSKSLALINDKDKDISYLISASLDNTVKIFNLKNMPTLRSRN